MKKLLGVLLAGVMTCSLLACGSSVPDNKVFSKADLKDGVKIGVQLGTTGDIMAADNEKEGAVVEKYSKGNDAVLSLKQGKVDCVIIDAEPAKYFVEKNDDLKVLDEDYATEDYAIAISKEKTELKDKINAALGELKNEGVLDQIIANYIGEDAGKTPYESPADVDRSNGTLTMATNAEFPPYEFREGEDIVGIDAQMAQAIADKLGMELKIEDMAFDSIINAVQSGKADIGVAGMTVTEDRLKNIDFTDSYTTSKQVVIVRKK